MTQASKQVEGWRERLALSRIITNTMEMSQPMEVYPVGFVEKYVSRQLHAHKTELLAKEDILYLSQVSGFLEGMSGYFEDDRQQIAKGYSDGLKKIVNKALDQPTTLEKDSKVHENV